MCCVDGIYIYIYCKFAINKLKAFIVVRWGISPAMQYWPYSKFSLWPSEAVPSLTLLHIRRYFISPCDDTPRQTISILYERNAFDSSTEPCSREGEFCCKRADVRVVLPKLSAVCVAYCFFSFPVIWTRKCALNVDSEGQCRFVLFQLNKLGTIHTCCFDWYVSSIGSHSWFCSSSWWCWSVHLFLVRHTFLLPVGMYSHINLEIRILSGLNKCCVHLELSFTADSLKFFFVLSSPFISQLVTFVW